MLTMAKKKFTYEQNKRYHILSTTEKVIIGGVAIAASALVLYEAVDTVKEIALEPIHKLFDTLTSEMDDTYNNLNRIGDQALDHLGKYNIEEHTNRIK